MFDAATLRYFDLLDALGHAVIVTDVGGRVQRWNPAAERLYGWSSAEVEGRDVVQVTPATMSRQHAEQIMSALAAGEAWAGEFSVSTRDGRSFMASVSDLPIIDADGNVAGIIGVSAPSSGPASLDDLLPRFIAACNTLWPERVVLELAPERLPVASSEPHLVQLLGLLMIRCAEALDRGAVVLMICSRADRTAFDDFGFHPREPFVWIRIGERDDVPKFSLLREVIRSTESVPYAAALVRIVGGKLFIGARPGRPHGSHLFIPAAGV